MYSVSIEFSYKSTSVLSRMQFSDWLRYSPSILFQYKSTSVLPRMPFSDWLRCSRSILCQQNSTSILLQMLQSDWLSYSYTISHQYHPTSGLIQILYFNWLRYQKTISNGPRVAKFTQSGMTLSFVLFPDKYFFNLHLLLLLCCSRKYPYHSHGRFFSMIPHPLWKFHFSAILSFIKLGF